mgnify:CR=1 FL=1
MFLLNPKQVDLGDYVGSRRNMPPIGNKALASGLLHHGVAQGPETLGPQTLPAAAPRGVIRRKLLGAQTKKPFAGHVKNDLLLHLPIREVKKKLPKDRLA